jgi:hypothetical protein
VACDIVDDDGVAQLEMVKQKDFKSSAYSRAKAEQLVGFYYESPELFGISEHEKYNSANHTDSEIPHSCLVQKMVISKKRKFR